MAPSESPTPRDPVAPDDSPWVEQVYRELRQLAQRRLDREAPGQTLQATALVHEAWMRLGGGAEAEPVWKDRTHFYAAAAAAMRRILIDQARRKQAVRHGGGWLRIDVPELDALSPPAGGSSEEERLEALEAALQRLAAAHPVHADLVRLRFYTGLTLEEASTALSISLATAKRHWAFARTWLLRELTRGANNK